MKKAIHTRPRQTNISWEFEEDVNITTDLARAWGGGYCNVWVWGAHDVRWVKRYRGHANNVDDATVCLSSVGLSNGRRRVEHRVLVVGFLLVSFIK